MSAFLAPIHYWLFNKIRRVERREQELFEQASEMCGSAAEELCEQIWQSYGRPLPEKDLSEMIDQSNIHGWLQKQINIVESREAALVKELSDMCGEAGRHTAAKAFMQNGTLCGADAKATGRYDVNTANGIYKALNDYFLNGMPCDQADMLVENSTDIVVWQSNVCLQEKNWTRAGVNKKMMAGLYQAWLAGFVQGANPAFEYVQTADVLAGDAISQHKISRK